MCSISNSNNINNTDIEVINSRSYLFEIFILVAAAATQEIAAKAGITKDAPICHFVKLQNSEWCVFPRGAIL